MVRWLFCALESWPFVKTKSVSGEYVEKVGLIIILLKVWQENGEGTLKSSCMHALLLGKLTCRDEPSTWLVGEGAGGFQWWRSSSHGPGWCPHTSAPQSEAACPEKAQQVQVLSTTSISDHVYKWWIVCWVLMLHIHEGNTYQIFLTATRLQLLSQLICSLFPQLTY